MDPSSLPTLDSRPALRLDVLPVPAFRDNYLWLLVRGSDAVVVDPGDAAPVERALDEHGLELRAILLTHHHADHTGGVAALSAARAGDRLAVHGPAAERIGGITDPVKEGDRVRLDGLDVEFDVLDVPGHTRGHVAYFARLADGAAPLLFCGDTLFAAGCGRLFEGTPEEMLRSLTKLAALPSETRVYCAHEYTLSNLGFARAVEPGNEALERRIADATRVRERGFPTLPSTIALERATNPFLRTDEPAVRDAAERQAPGARLSSLATFTALRRWKDAF